jgi:hypothetical protein
MQGGSERPAQRTISTEHGAWRLTFSAVVPRNMPHMAEWPLWPSTIRSIRCCLYRPDVHVERASDDPAGRSGPVHYRARVLPLFERYLYGPVRTRIRPGRPR